MHRLIVVILASIDAAIAAAVGLAATLAPLTLLWVFGLGGTADWNALWPASVRIWQFGNLVPLQVTLPGEYLAVAGIDQGAASFVLSLAPLAFAAFTAIFAVRSGVRASRAEAWVTGFLTGTVVFASAATLVAVTSTNSIVATELWQAIAFPTLVFAVPLLAGAVVTEWREAGSGVIARVRDRIEAAPHGWGETIGLIARGGAVVWAGLIGAGALLLALGFVLRGGEVVALYEAAHVDALGATVVTLAQFAYLPTLVVWGIAFIAGPGFAVGAGTAVSPAGTQLGVVPGIPVLGVLPESTTSWLLLLALIPVGLGALAGWIARSRLAVHADAGRADAVHADAGHADAVRADAVRGAAAFWVHDASSSANEGSTDESAHERIGARVVIAVGIAAVSAVGAAVLSALAAGSIGPGRLAAVGPDPGPIALAVGLEVLVGAGILLLAPRSHESRTAAEEILTTGGSDPAVVDSPTAFSSLAARETGWAGRPTNLEPAHTDAEAAPTNPEPARTNPEPAHPDPEPERTSPEAAHPDPEPERTSPDDHPTTPDDQPTAPIERLP